MHDYARMEYSMLRLDVYRQRLACAVSTPAGRRFQEASRLPLLANRKSKRSTLGEAKMQSSSTKQRMMVIYHIRRQALLD